MIKISCHSQKLAIFFSILTIVALGFSHPLIALAGSLAAVTFGLIHIFPEVFQRMIILSIIYNPGHTVASLTSGLFWAAEKAFRKRFGGNGWIEGLDDDDMTPSMRKKEEQCREREAETDLLFMD